jgi:ribonuclease I
MERPRGRRSACVVTGRRVARILLSLAALGASLGASAPPLQPAVHGDFGHYTFALTWQPGFCTTSRERCVASQPRRPLIGLHGLWPSLPQALIVAGVRNPTWWRRGCDLFHHSDAAPRLRPAVSGELDAVMPHLRASLLVHEFDKHVQCFSYDANAFFATELTMRDAVVRSPFGAYLARNAGRVLRHGDVVATFDATFRVPGSTALQLECARDDAGALVFTQLWITIRRTRANAFPAPASLMNTAPSQDTCPTAFLVPSWRGFPTEAPTASGRSGR